MSSYRVGIDIGGTFTDLVYFDEGSKAFSIVKVPTTPKKPAEGTSNAIKAAKLDYRKIYMLVHATTLGTNMFLGQENLVIPALALITTKGFRDVLEIRRQKRAELYNLFFEKPKPIVQRRDRFEIEERVGVRGEIITALDKDGLRDIAKKIRASGYEIVVISFLHSYKNPEHEKKAKEIIEAECPNIEVITSHEVDPEYKEYERTSTTVINAFLKPLMSDYLTDLIGTFSRENFTGKFLVMQSSGGVSNVNHAIDRPAAFVESGPAAGAVAVACYSKAVGDLMVIGFDMGGTTAKVSTVVNHEPTVTSEYEVGSEVHGGRMVKGSGYPVRFPFIDLAEVSAGGGTLAWVDEGGALRIGPMSAGADPGPACYGQGNTEPTITDANLFLGRLGDTLSGGSLKLAKDLAGNAISGLADKLGASREDAALGIIKLANTVMAKALRMATIERGYDPRDFVMYVFGGAGPLHGMELAEELNVESVLIPPHTGVFSAQGLLLSDYRADKVRSVIKPVDKIDEREIDALFLELAEEAIREVSSENIEVKAIRQGDLHYRGQAYEITVPWAGSMKECLESFHRKHESLYGFSSPEEQVDLVNLRVTAVGILPRPEIKAERKEKYIPTPRSHRRVYFSERWEMIPVYNRDVLVAGARIEGPAIVEEYDSTIAVPAGYLAVVDQYRNMKIGRR